MRYSTDEFSGISSILKIDLKLFSIVMIIVFLGMITLFSVSSGDSSLMLKQGIRILIGLVACLQIYDLEVQEAMFGSRAIRTAHEPPK